MQSILYTHILKCVAHENCCFSRFLSIEDEEDTNHGFWGRYQKGVFVLKIWDVGKA